MSEQEMRPSYQPSGSSPKSATNWGPSILTNESMRVTSHSNYHKRIFFLERKVNLKVVLNLLQCLSAHWTYMNVYTHTHKHTQIKKFFLKRH